MELVARLNQLKQKLENLQSENKSSNGKDTKQHDKELQTCKKQIANLEAYLSFNVGQKVTNGLKIGEISYLTLSPGGMPEVWVTWLSGSAPVPEQPSLLTPYEQDEEVEVIEEVSNFSVAVNNLKIEVSHSEIEIDNSEVEVNNNETEVTSNSYSEAVNTSPLEVVNNNKPNIIIDPRLKALIPPLSPQEKKQLETNVLAEGIRDPLVLWKSDRALRLLDGHNRFDIALLHNLDFKTVEIELENEEQACLWIINNQLGRRNLLPEQISYLRGQRYNLEKTVGHGTKLKPLMRSTMLSDSACQNDPQFDKDNSACQSDPQLVTNNSADHNDPQLGKNNSVDHFDPQLGKNNSADQNDPQIQSDNSNAQNDPQIQSDNSEAQNDPQFQPDNSADQSDPQVHSLNGDHSKADNLSTAERLADIYKVGSGTIKRDADFARAVDFIAETLGDNYKQAILSREIRLPKNALIEIADSASKDPKDAFNILESFFQNYSHPIAKQEVLTPGCLVKIKNSNKTWLVERTVRVATVSAKTVCVWHRNIDTLAMEKHSLTLDDVEKVELGDHSHAAVLSARVSKLRQFNLDPFESDILNLLERCVALTPTEEELLNWLELRYQQ